MKMTEKKLEENIKNVLLETLKTRFETNPERHKNLKWEDAETRLLAGHEKLWSLNEMEKSGGEPDIVKAEHGTFGFMDCSEESPKGRRSLCYDQSALESRKKHKPESSAKAMLKRWASNF